MVHDSTPWHGTESDLGFLDIHIYIHGYPYILDIQFFILKIPPRVRPVIWNYGIFYMVVVPLVAREEEIDL